MLKNILIKRSLDVDLADSDFLKTLVSAASTYTIVTSNQCYGQQNSSVFVV